MDRLREAIERWYERAAEIATSDLPQPRQREALAEIEETVRQLRRTLREIQELEDDLGFPSRIGCNAAQEWEASPAPPFSRWEALRPLVRQLLDGEARQGRAIPPNRRWLAEEGEEDEAL